MSDKPVNKVLLIVSLINGQVLSSETKQCFEGYLNSIGEERDDLTVTYSSVYGNTRTQSIFRSLIYPKKYGRLSIEKIREYNVIVVVENGYTCSVETLTNLVDTACDGAPNVYYAPLKIDQHAMCGTTSSDGMRIILSADDDCIEADWAEARIYAFNTLVSEVVRHALVGQSEFFEMDVNAFILNRCKPEIVSDHSAGLSPVGECFESQQVNVSKMFYSMAEAIHQKKQIHIYDQLAKVGEAFSLMDPTAYVNNADEIEKSINVLINTLANELAQLNVELVLTKKNTPAQDKASDVPSDENLQEKVVEHTEVAGPADQPQ